MLVFRKILRTNEMDNPQLYLILLKLLTKYITVP